MTPSSVACTVCDEVPAAPDIRVVVSTLAEDVCGVDVPSSSWLFLIVFKFETGSPCVAQAAWNL
jgi:hypothetical protein